MSVDRVDKVVDCIGLYCPMPVLNVRKEIDTLSVGQVIEMWADDPAAEPDLEAWAKRTGHKLLAVEKHSEGMRFLIQKAQ